MNTLSLYERWICTPSLIPSDSEMYIKEASTLKSVELCPFLKDIDTQERLILEMPEADRKTPEEQDEIRCKKMLTTGKVKRIAVDIFAVASSAAFCTVLGPIGVVGMGCVLLGMLDYMVVSDLRLKESCMDAGKARIKRMMRKIKIIREKLLNLDGTTNRDQLNIAIAYLQQKIERYNYLRNITPRFLNIGGVTYWYDRDGTFHGNGVRTDIDIRINYYAGRREVVYTNTRVNF